MNIKILGGGQEVGRSAVQITSKNERYIFDYGINVQDMSIPMKPTLPVDAVFLSHAHLDHSGNVPYLFNAGFNGKIVATQTTFSLSYLLLKDSLKVQGLNGLTPTYMPSHINKMDRIGMRLNYKKKIKIKNSSFELRDAGHTPGSAAVLGDINNKRFLYTGDINFIETTLLRKADTNYKNIDVLITEATYSYKNHPSRKKSEKQLIKKINDVISQEGNVILPSFAIGRTQEILLIAHKTGVPIFLDGMGIDATRRSILHKNTIKNPKKLRRAFGFAKKIGSQKQRSNAIKSPSVIITTSGMLNGGPVGWYINKLHKKENCSLILTGFQVPGTVGRTLVDTGRYVNGKIDIKPKMNIDFMDFSSHCGRTNLINFIKNVNPKKVVLVHTDNGPKFSNELKSMGFDSSAPKNGETIKF